MTPRQRRGVLLLFVAGIGAILVFSLISGYVSDVRKEVEPKTGVLVLTRAVPELQPIPPDAVRLKSVPEKYVGRQALRDVSQIGALVPNEPLPAGVELQQGMLV
jgi:pilus assembly protein CpaB